MRVLNGSNNKVTEFGDIALARATVISIPEGNIPLLVFRRNLTKMADSGVADNRSLN